MGRILKHYIKECQLFILDFTLVPVFYGKRGAKMHVKVANVESEYMNEVKSIPVIS